MGSEMCIRDRRATNEMGEDTGAAGPFVSGAAATKSGFASDARAGIGIMIQNDFFESFPCPRCWISHDEW